MAAPRAPVARPLATQPDRREGNEWGTEKEGIVPALVILTQTSSRDNLVGGPVNPLYTVCTKKTVTSSHLSTRLTLGTELEALRALGRCSRRRRRGCRFIEIAAISPVP